MSPPWFLVYDPQLFSALIYFDVKNESSEPRRENQESQNCEKVVTILREDGGQVTYGLDVYVEKFVQDHPGHAVCHAKTLLLRGLCRVLFPRTLLLRGECYIMISMVGSHPLLTSRIPHPAPPVLSRSSPNAPESSASKEKLVTGAQPGPLHFTRFVITRQQVVSILGRGSSSCNEGNYHAALPDHTSQAATPSSVAQPVHLNQKDVPTFHLSNTFSRRKITMRWSPRLPSIPEMPIPGTSGSRQRYEG